VETAENPSAQVAPAPSDPLFPILLALFAASGAAALIYEIVWLQLLQLVIGSSAVSLAVLLGTWMGGMCLGSVLFARVVSAKQNALRVYALLEAGTAVCGILVLFGLPLIEKFYLAGISSGLPNTILRGVACAICLLPPTLLMGATLPAISRWVSATPGAAVWWGYLYGANIGGGVVGCFAAGFYLLRVRDMAFASYVAAALNLAVAGVSMAIRGGEKPAPAVSAEAAPTGLGSVYFAIGVSGRAAR